jgi:tripartite-type tricarboxylate transporter receptor subunit TctC
METPIPRSRQIRRLASLLLFALPILFRHDAALAQASRTSSGNEIRLLVGQPPGGGYDLYARLFAQFLPRFLPGNPVVVSQNMPGAGSILMANYIYSQAAPDGMTLGMGGGTITTAELFSLPGARFDSRKFSWIGSMNSEIGVSVSWKPSSVNNADDLFTHELVVGGAGATSNSVIFPNALNKILGTKFKVIAGYQGSADTALAMERGEIAGVGAWNYSSIASSKPEWIHDQKMNFLLQVSLTKHPSLPTVPTALEVSRNDDQRRLLSLILAQQRIGRPILAPPGVAPERLAVLRSGFLRMMHDAEFQSEAEKLSVEIIQPMAGDDIDKLINELYSAPPDLIAKASAAMSGSNK